MAAEPTSFYNDDAYPHRLDNGPQEASDDLARLLADSQFPLESSLGQHLPTTVSGTSIAGGPPQDNVVPLRTGQAAVSRLMIAWTQPAADTACAERYTEAMQTGQYWLKQHRSPKVRGAWASEALAQFCRAQDVAPTDTNTQCQLSECLAECYYHLGQWEKAFQYASKALALGKTANHMAGTAHTILGLYYVKHHALPQAKHHLGLGGQHDRVLGALAQWHLLQLCMKTRPNPQPSLRSVKHVLTDIAQNTSHWAQATRAALGMVQRYRTCPQRLSWQEGLTFCQTLIEALQAENQQDAEKELALLKTLRQQFPGMSSLLLMQGHVHQSLGNIDDALHHYTLAIKHKPTCEMAWLEKAALLEHLGQFEAAYEAYQKLIQLSPANAEYYCHLGNMAFKLERPEETMRLYQLALRYGHDKPWKATVAMSLSRLYRDFEHNLPACEMTLTLATQLDPSNQDAFIQLGLCLYEQANYAGAEQVYHQALQLNNLSESNKAQLQCSLGFLHWLKQNEKEAIACYQQAITLDSAYDIPHNNLGVIYLDAHGRTHDAIACFEQAIAVNPTYAMAHFNLGRAHSVLGNRLQAAKAFRQASTLNQLTCELDKDDLNDRLEALFDV